MMHKNRKARREEIAVWKLVLLPLVLSGCVWTHMQNLKLESEFNRELAGATQANPSPTLVASLR